VKEDPQRHASSARRPGARLVWTLVRLRARLYGRALRSVASNWLKLATVLVFGSVLWFGFLALFINGFQFLNRPPFSILIRPLLYLFFFVLLLMLTFSNAIIAYASVFRSREASWMGARPVPWSHAFGYFLADAVLFSSWATAFLAVPVILALGYVLRAPWYYYPGGLALLVPFIMLAGGVGALFALAVAGLVSVLGGRVLLAAVVVAAVAGGALGLREVWLWQDADLSQPGVITQRLGTFAFAGHWLWPSVWVVKGLTKLVTRTPGRAGFYLLVLAANALFFPVVALEIAGRAYGRLWNALVSRGGSARKGRSHALAHVVRGAFFYVSRPVTALVVKDLKTFLRDATQWSQFILFFGLLAVYFLNLRGLRYDQLPVQWKVFVAFLNLGATLLVLATFTSRFIFPLPSLEGETFWVLALAPVERRSILIGKFLFAFTGSALTAEALILLSDLMLGMSWGFVAIHMLTVIFAAMGLVGISLGLGALYPEIHERNPSKIVSGFGGTLNWVVSFLFIAVVLATEMAATYYCFLGPDSVLSATGPTRWAEPTAAAARIVIAVSVIATAVPMSLGIRAFDRQEF
jgi:ABC-2 type transport system permease protein